MHYMEIECIAVCLENVRFFLRALRKRIYTFSIERKIAMIVLCVVYLT